MYASCLYCHSELGSNRVVEHMSTGRRLAFDPARGRLWIVCARCNRWNLTPFAERWEAIEDCQLLYERTATVVSSDQISLTKLRGELILIRVGSPTRAEFSAWRYGDRLRARRRARYVKVGSGLAAAATFGVAGVTAGISLGLLLYGYVYWGVVARGDFTKPVASFPRVDGDSYLLYRSGLRRLRIFQPSKEPWFLGVKGPLDVDELRLAGDEAVMALGLALPLVNRFGASGKQVDEAVKILGERDPRCFIEDAAANNTHLRLLPKSVRVALEMAAHEETERAAADNELALLELAWEAAENIAAIADSLLVPRSVHKAWMRLRSASQNKGT